jgi:hypothetical protein
MHRAEELLEACAEGDLGAIRSLLDEGLPPDAAEFDGRTGLMLATARYAASTRCTALLDMPRKYVRYYLHALGET